MVAGPRPLSPAEQSLIERMPKAELHVHLEGSVRPATLLELGRRYGLHYPFNDLAGANEWFRFRDFPHFIAIYVAICHALRSAEDYERVAYELAEDAYHQRIAYLEVTFAPVTPGDPHGRPGPDVALKGIRAGARRARADFDVRMQFILDPVRTRSVDVVMEFARFTAANLGDGLVGFGLGGLEAGFPPTPFARAFAYARDAGARLSLHAGETAGPESIRAALAVGAERIGHGIRAIEDPELVRELAAPGTILEVAPISNVRLGVVRALAEHPIRALDAAGVQVTLNSDDPPMFGTTLTDEYRLVAARFGYTSEELAARSLRAARATFLPSPERERLVARFEAELAALHPPGNLAMPAPASRPATAFAAATRIGRANRQQRGYFAGIHRRIELVRGRNHHHASRAGTPAAKPAVATFRGDESLPDSQPSLVPVPAGCGSNTFPAVGSAGRSRYRCMLSASLATRRSVNPGLNVH